MTRFRKLVPAAAVLALAVAGCGGSDELDRSELEKEVQTELSKSVGAEAPKASCPEALKAEKGATARCSMTFPDGKLGITVKVTSAEGDNVKFSVEADEEIKPK